MKKHNKVSIRILNWRDVKHPLAGGAELSLHEQAKVWMKMGAEVSWYSASWKNAKKNEIVDGVRVFRMGNQFTVHFLFLARYFIHKVPKVDVCIDSFHFIPYFSPFYIKKEKIYALINEVAGDLWYYNSPKPVAFIGKVMEPIIIRAYKKIPFITASNSTVQELVRIGIPHGHISTVYHGVTVYNPKKNIVKEADPTILFVNRISQDKGIEDILKIFTQLHKSNKRIQLWIAGKEENEGLLRELLQKYNIQKKVQYFGFVSESQKFNLMKRAWILVHPSRKEGWGLTVIEAASQGTPSVGYDVEGLRDSIQNEKTGLLVTSNSEGLLSGIQKLLSDSTLRGTLAKNAIVWSQKFSWKNAGEKSWKIIYGS